MSVDRIGFKIVESIKRGDDASALDYLYNQPLKKIRKYILSNNGTREDANDIFQDTVIVLFNQIKKEKYNVDLDLDGFLFVVARNLWVDKVRKEKKRSVKDFSQEYDYTDHSNQLKDLITKERSTALNQVFSQLDERCQKLLHYSIYDKLSMREISVKMGYSNENVAKSNHYRCKKSLAAIVKDNPNLISLLRD